MIPRRYQKELTRIKTCMDAQAVALAAQKKSIAKIHGAGSSSYVHDALDVHRKRTEREESAQEPGHDNRSGISAYHEMLKWDKRENMTDIAEAETPCRNGVCLKCWYQQDYSLILSAGRSQLQVDPAPDRWTQHFF